MTGLGISVGGSGHNWYKGPEKRFGTCKGMEKPKPRAESATGNLLANVEVATWQPEKGVHNCDEHH